MKQKMYRGRMEFKADADETGQFRAVFATLNVVDHDGDVTEPGAFQDGQETLIEAWNHTYYDLPVGKGIIHEEDDLAIVEGYFFLDTEGGMEHYRTMKNLGELAEWSYTFDITDSGQGKFEEQDVRFLRGLDVWGIAPVERGAGIGTRTLAIKGQKRALASHSTATTDAAWDGPANEARARSGEDEAYYRRIYAWKDPEGAADVKASYKFVHHMVDGDGNPGAANIRGCQSAIGVLNGGRGGTTIPDADRQGVWSHLARHLRDADLEPPELKGLEELEGKRRPTGASLQISLGECKSEDVQKAHDLLVALGAKCPSQGEVGDDKPRSKETLAARVALELVEAGFDPE